METVLFLKYPLAFLSYMLVAQCIMWIKKMAWDKSPHGFVFSLSLKLKRNKDRNFIVKLTPFVATGIK
jgi:hypothetical protein